MWQCREPRGEVHEDGSPVDGFKDFPEQDGNEHTAFQRNSTNNENPNVGGTGLQALLEQSTLLINKDSNVQLRGQIAQNFGRGEDRSGEYLDPSGVFSCFRER